MIDKDILKEARDMCPDNRFKLMEKYKKILIIDTDIETSKDEMAVIDDGSFNTDKVLSSSVLYDCKLISLVTDKLISDKVTHSKVAVHKCIVFFA